MTPQIGKNFISYVFFRRRKTKRLKLPWIFRSIGERDNVFLNVADRNVLGNRRALPTQLTPISLETLALIQISGLSLPGSFFTKADANYAPILLHMPVQPEAARLILAERMAEKGVLSPAGLASIYGDVKFRPESLAQPEVAAEAGSRLRALLYQVAGTKQDRDDKIDLALTFVKEAPPTLLNGAGLLVASMVGSLKPDPDRARNAASLAYIYMVAGKREEAQQWFDLAKKTETCASEIQRSWPQFVLEGYESDASYDDAFHAWFKTAVKTANPQTMRDVIVPSLLYLETAGKKVPSAVWGKTFVLSKNEKKVGLSPLILARLQSAASAQRRAETVLLSGVLAGEEAIPLLSSLTIVSSLRQSGFSYEAATFARQAVALLGTGL